jgi:hypothetical protein
VTHRNIAEVEILVEDTRQDLARAIAWWAEQGYEVGGYSIAWRPPTEYAAPDYTGSLIYSCVMIAYEPHQPTP